MLISSQLLTSGCSLPLELNSNIIVQLNFWAIIAPFGRKLPERPPS